MLGIVCVSVLLFLAGVVIAVTGIFLLGYVKEWVCYTMIVVGIVLASPVMFGGMW